MYEIIQKGGLLMWPLLACSFVTVAIVIERAIFWLRVAMAKNQKQINRTFELTEQGSFETAIDEARQTRCMTCRILTMGLAHRNYGLTANLETAAGVEIAAMKRGLSLLDTIITLAPLLGILGTVSGIIVSFDLLGDSGIEDPKAVTEGIAQALLTTAAGLTVAIITLLPHNALVNKVETVTHYLEKMCSCYAVTVQKGEETRGA
ncbi:MAG: MotA/TolQ/ExbB proton channel family protein [Kiritimatiellae bacterium]|nr:MotA/TolQ/ExbB proton channel family protein [Kiritimatiellia bacterium]